MFKAMKKLSILFFALLSSFALQAQVNWQADATHSSIGFNVSHLSISEVEGEFKDYEINVSSSKIDDFSSSNISFSAKVASVDTDNEKRDGHLQSADFFDAANHPSISFKSTSVEKVGDNSYTVTGDLTMRGVTKTVTLEATHGGTINHPMMKKNVAGFKVVGKVKRSDFGIEWNTMVVGDEVEIICKLELVEA